jgi:Ser/Thr protein kinase RdoA (MazF antagonist)
MSMTAITHGLDGTLVEADWPPIALDEARTLLAKFPDCGDARKILTVSPRPFSAASVVETTRGKVFIKRHPREVRDREGLHEEHRFMQFLRSHGAPVPRVFADVSGETAIEMGPWSYEVHEAPEGMDIYADALSWTPFLSVAHARSAGEMLAQLHLAARGFDAPQRKPQPLVASFTIFANEDPRTAIKRYLKARLALVVDETARQGCDEALELLAPFHVDLLPLLTALEPLWTHNDLHASNLLWNGVSTDAQAVTVIDFGLADLTNAVHDLAHAIERNIVEWLALRPGSEERQDVPVHLDHLRALLDGYESVRPLSDAEVAALAPMTALCHAEFALTEADYFLGVVHSEKNARLASMDYLAGHARWFRGMGGRNLLEAIRRWAVNRDRQGAAIVGVEARCNG